MKSKIHENRKNNIKLIAKIFLFNLILVTKFCVAQVPANAPIIPIWLRYVPASDSADLQSVPTKTRK
jgi:hypothetical protein